VTSARCASAIAFLTLVAYWAGDLPPADSDSIEVHLMGCASCTATSARVAAVVQAIRAQIPPIVTRDDVTKLRARGLRVVDNAVQSGERKLATFPTDADLLIHHLGGLDLEHATRVAVTVKVEETGEIIFLTDDAPFDPEAGEVLIACQRHFSAYPPNLVFEVRRHDASHRETLAVYLVPHVFG
jgi:hypothetical protein